ncbi:DUF2283 domain-containing protein [Methanocaldococcus fervens]|uniref:DUF2283 domain-containing protein n=1 Tax=Methanocaldococcus fervens (strain DSM 4213 / JCM 15782 / AG86) TaxID=573064 RepID=C7P8D2_METFA|nr:DUF2283 domain-containing protein [Methanocaldococcus fervens]ACV24814.1 hypothetical protein Mefer_0996 [Methanocaldococcus fervens AG86]
MIFLFDFDENGDVIGIEILYLLRKKKIIKESVIKRLNTVGLKEGEVTIG